MSKSFFTEEEKAKYNRDVVDDEIISERFKKDYLNLEQIMKIEKQRLKPTEPKIATFLKQKIIQNHVKDNIIGRIECDSKISLKMI